MLEREMLLNTLDLLKVGIFLTDGSGRIAHANHAGLVFLADASALMRSGARLSAQDRKSARELAQAIAEAAADGGTRLIPKAGIAVPITGRDGRDLGAWVLPLNGRSHHDDAASFEACVAVFVRELEDTSLFPAELFRRRFGATPAECRVLMLLSRGMTVKDAAETLGVSLTTVKTHLGNLFEKTGTQRQADLMRLAAGAAAPASA